MAAQQAIRKKRRTLTGEIISSRMDKTVIVMIERIFMHPTYKKVVRKATKVKAHDEKNECRMGDTVKILETRPLSKEKHWRVIEIVHASRRIQSGETESPAALS